MLGQVSSGSCSFYLYGYGVSLMINPVKKDQIYKVQMINTNYLHRDLSELQNILAKGIFHIDVDDKNPTKNT